MVKILGVKLDFRKSKYDSEFVKKQDNILKMLTKEKIESIFKFKRNEDLIRSFVAELLFRYMLTIELGLDFDVEVAKNKCGKPFLKNYDNVHFNITHSGVYVICAISDKIVGVDVETIKEIDFGIAKRFFTNAEYENLINKQDREKLERFFELWTLKESYIKADGRGLTLGLNTFSMEISNEIKVITNNELCECNFNVFKLDENYMFAICSEEKIKISDFELITIDELIRNIEKLLDRI